MHTYDVYSWSLKSVGIPGKQAQPKLPQIMTLAWDYFKLLNEFGQADHPKSVVSKPPDQQLPGYLHMRLGFHQNQQTTAIKYSKYTA